MGRMKRVLRPLALAVGFAIVGVPHVLAEDGTIGKWRDEDNEEEKE
jgi:hypothetical protein